MKQAGKCALCWIGVKLYAVKKIQVQRRGGSWEVVIVLNNVAKADSLGKCCLSKDPREMGSSGAPVGEPRGQEEQQVQMPWGRSPPRVFEEEQASAAGGRVQGIDYQDEKSGGHGGWGDHAGPHRPCHSWMCHLEEHSCFASSQRMKPI